MANNQLYKQMEKFLEMSGTFLEQAYAIREMVNTIESEKATAELNNKLIRIKARENWANAEVRYYRALKDNQWCAASFYDVKGQVFVEKPLKPILYKGDYQPNIPPNCRTPQDWERIWMQVANRLHKYHKYLTYHFADGRNPQDVAMSPLKVIVQKE